MKASQADIFIIPDFEALCDDHWQMRWQNKLSTAKVIAPSCKEPAAWLEDIRQALQSADKPIIVVAHGLGVGAVLRVALAHKLAITGALLVAPTDLENPKLHQDLAQFGPYPTHKLPFPAIVVASQDDAHCPMATAQKLADDWGVKLVDGGKSGHINTDSGHGPWPEGSLLFAHFLAKLA